MSFFCHFVVLMVLISWGKNSMRPRGEAYRYGFITRVPHPAVPVITTSVHYIHLVMTEEDVNSGNLRPNGYFMWFKSYIREKKDQVGFVGLLWHTSRYESKMIMNFGEILVTTIRYLKWWYIAWYTTRTRNIIVINQARSFHFYRLRTGGIYHSDFDQCTRIAHGLRNQELENKETR